MSALETPVALLIFNRPEPTQQVFDAIAKARPRQLFVIADGPRADRTTDESKCAAARAIAERIDWPCEVVRNYSQVNLGCGRRVSSGLDWLFAQVEEAIILEDDCLPSPSFFPYCEQLLAHYRNDRRIMHISGCNFQRGVRRSPESYYFSRIPHVWGWATWRRAWRYYDFRMSAWPDFKARRKVRGVFPDPHHAAFWSRFFDEVYHGALDTWDLQWVLACWSQGALSAMPEVNLISNVGTGVDATHTPDDAWFMNLPTCELGEISHPMHVLASDEADYFTMREVYGCPDEKSRSRQTLHQPRPKRGLKARLIRLLKGESKVFPYRRWRQRKRAA